MTWALIVYLPLHCRFLKPRIGTSLRRTRHFGPRRSIRGDLYRLRIGLHEPDSPVFVVVDKFEILGFVHFARPHHLGVIDVRGVVDPLIHWLVIRGISNDRELSSGYLLETGLNLRA